MLTYGLLACSSFDAQPCELRLLHAAIKGGKVTKAGEHAAVRVTVIVCCTEIPSYTALAWQACLMLPPTLTCPLPPLQTCPSGAQ